MIKRLSWNDLLKDAANANKPFLLKSLVYPYTHWLFFNKRKPTPHNELELLVSTLPFSNECNLIVTDN